MKKGKRKKQESKKEQYSAVQQPRQFLKLPSNPALRFTPYAWAKLSFFRNQREDCEVSCFGQTMEDDLLCVEDILLPVQQVGGAVVDLNQDSVNDLIAEAALEGIPPYRSSRVWIHTHPGMGTNPSGTDEDTFMRTYSQMSWAVMCILDQNLTGAYIRLQYSPTKSPVGFINLHAEIAWDQPFPGVSQQDKEHWKELYEKQVTTLPPTNFLCPPFDPKGCYQGGYDEELWDTREVYIDLLKEDFGVSGTMECPACNATISLKALEYMDWKCPKCYLDVVEEYFDLSFEEEKEEVGGKLVEVASVEEAKTRKD